MSAITAKRKFEELSEQFTQPLHKNSEEESKTSVAKPKRLKIINGAYTHNSGRKSKTPKKVSAPTSKTVNVKVGNKVVQRHQCNVCKYNTNRADNMRKHLLVHSEERPEKCEICGLAFKDRSNCLAHTKLVHSSLRPFPCTVCGKKFKTPKHLRQHSHIHNPNGKPHKCEHCSYASVNKCVLREHIDMVHLGKSKYQCILCGKGIKSKSSLDYHMGIHRKESLLVKTLKKESIEQKKEIKRLTKRVEKLTGQLKTANLASMSHELQVDLQLLQNFANSVPGNPKKSFTNSVPGKRKKSFTPVTRVSM
jgi:hypothetical protein